MTLSCLIDYTIHSELHKFYTTLLVENKIPLDNVEYDYLKESINAEPIIFEKFIKSFIEWNIIKFDQNKLHFIEKNTGTSKQELFRSWMCQCQIHPFNESESLENKISNIKDFLNEENILVNTNWDYYLVCFLKEILLPILLPNNLFYLLQTGACIFNKTFQIDGGLPFQSYEKAIRLMEIFSARFAIQWQGDDLQVLQNLNLNNSSILDVGGGSGGLAKAISDCSILPKKYTLLDLQETTNCLVNLRKIFFDSLTSEKEIIYFDFFRPINYQHKFDFIFLSWILHDWSNDQCLILLNNIKPLLNENGKIIVVERCMDSNRFTKMNFADFLITATAGGMERTKSEYVSILAKAKFNLERVDFYKNGRDFMIFSIVKN